MRSPHVAVGRVTSYLTESSTDCERKRAAECYPANLAAVWCVLCWAGFAGVAAGAGASGDTTGAQLGGQEVAAVPGPSTTRHAGRTTHRQGLLLPREVPGNTTDTLPLLSEVRLGPETRDASYVGTLLLERWGYSLHLWLAQGWETIYAALLQVGESYSRLIPNTIKEAWAVLQPER